MKIGDSIFADVIYNHIVHEAYSIVIECEDALRKRKSLNAKQ